MNWLVFFIFAYVMLVLDLGLDVLLAINGISPSFTLILGVFVVSYMPMSLITWAFLLLGLFQDLTFVHQSPGWEDMPLIGPHCLGYLAGGLVGAQFRGQLLRDSLVAMVVMTFVVGIFVELVMVGLLVVRGLPVVPVEPVIQDGAAHELVRRFLALVYTSVLALPVGYLLIKSVPLWRFAMSKGGLGRTLRGG